MLDPSTSGQGLEVLGLDPLFLASIELDQRLALVRAMRRVASFAHPDTSDDDMRFKELGPILSRLRGDAAAVREFVEHATRLSAAQHALHKRDSEIREVVGRTATVASTMRNYFEHLLPSAQSSNVLCRSARFELFDVNTALNMSHLSRSDEGSSYNIFIDGFKFLMGESKKKYPSTTIEVELTKQQHRVRLTLDARGVVHKFAPGAIRNKPDSQTYPHTFLIGTIMTKDISTLLQPGDSRHLFSDNLVFNSVRRRIKGLRLVSAHYIVDRLTPCELKPLLDLLSPDISGVENGVSDQFPHLLSCTTSPGEEPYFSIEGIVLKLKRY